MSIVGSATKRCLHGRVQRVSPDVEWCAMCGAYRLFSEWVLPFFAKPDCDNCDHPARKHATPGGECVQVTGRDAQGFEAYCTCGSYR